MLDLYRHSGSTGLQFFRFLHVEQTSHAPESKPHASTSTAPEGEKFWSILLEFIVGPGRGFGSGADGLVSRGLRIFVRGFGRLVGVA